MSRPVSLLGLGGMGSPMAEVLARGGVDLTVWNRTAGRAAPFAALGATVAATPADAAGPVVLTVLTDSASVDAVIDGSDGLLAGWERRAVSSPILVVMGTVSPPAMRDLAARLAPSGVRVVDAPLSGGVIGAAEARLSVMVGADPADFAELLPVFEILGKVVRHLGPVGSGQLAKACNQLIVAATMTAVSEAMLLARESGLDRAVLLELLSGGLAGSEVLRQKGENWVTESFRAGGSAANQLKDLNFALAAAEEGQVELPLSRTVHGLFTDLIAAGDGGLDHSGIFRALERLASGSRRDASRRDAGPDEETGHAPAG
ncbi:NAD(P)-dependent oxidoreductase [Planctomonas psychrotolerans]|uniref:NAD(P)-dependent oxidoreductase n=1 Tax=Planctomonas psychrotolerans TaxID=2528712 RepID=UPI001D0D6975|nr:NAD(P)-dependent oxidoreductase [Planctomonas psychrotolerans]